MLLALFLLFGSHFFDHISEKYFVTSYFATYSKPLHPLDLIELQSESGLLAPPVQISTG